MGEFSYLRCKTRVYKFGVVWHWKCKPSCGWGGRSRAWDKAFERAVDHARSGIKTITYREED
ncbi:hypothetical protein GCM10010149_88130 [Nonomuraea roseoviolacea subsp. roseoviolacea]|uniref:hypothetical protein n=1 Tax=Nonomuraea roseoviolacea TaxID=103837 RepID=UPI0031D42730